MYIFNETLLHKTVVFCVVLQNFLGAHFDICRGGLKDLYGHGILYAKFSGQIGSEKWTNFDKRMSKSSKRDQFYCLLEAITCRKCLNMFGSFYKVIL